MKKTLIATEVVSLLLLAPQIHAEETQTSTSTTNALETMVVIGKSDNINSIADIPSNIQVIGKEEIERSGAKSLDSLLRSRAGIQVSDSNSGPVFSIRGFSGSQAAHNTLILVDGRRLNKQDLSSPKLNTILLNQVERIEILSGSAGVLYGDQAVGGVINIITLNNSRDSGDISLSAGNMNSRAGSVSISRSLVDNWRYSVSASQDNSDNYRDHNARKSGMLLGRLDYQNSDKAFYSEVSYYDNNREYAGSMTEEQFHKDPTKADETKPDDHRHEITRALRIGYGQDVSEKWATNADVSLDRMSATGVSWNSGFNTSNDNISGAFKLEGVIGQKLNTLIGLDVGRNDYKYKSSSISREVEQLLTSVYSQFNYKMTDHVAVVAGGRYGRVQDDITDAQTYVSGEKLNEDATAAELGINIRPTANTRYYVRAESNYRFAKTDEQGRTPASVKGLKPQLGYSFEAGWNHIGDDYLVKFDAYNLRLKDEIVYDRNAEKPTGASGNGANVNAAKSERNGVGLYFDKYLIDSILVGAEYNYVNAKFIGGENKDKKVPWVSEHTGRLFTDIDITEDVQTYIEGAYVGERFHSSDNSNSDKKLPSYWLANLALNYTLDAWTASLRIDNVLDKQYVSQAYGHTSYYAGDGRKFLVTAAYQF